MTNLDSILKSRDITLPTKVWLVKAMVFPVVMFGCESWTIKKAERRRIDAFELWCWRRLLGVPWTARRSNQSILKEISPEYSLEELMLKLQFLGHLMQRTDSFEKTLMLERLKAAGERDDRGWDSWMALPTRQTWVWVKSRSWWWTGKVGVLPSMGLQNRTRLSDWTELSWLYSKFPLAFYFTYGSVKVSMLLSPFIPPSPSSPTPVSISLFCMSVSLLERKWSRSVVSDSLRLHGL